MREPPLILAVDDEESFLEIISTKLKSAGFQVALAHNESEAIRESARLMPDLILMDIHLGGPSGTDAALAIKQNSKTKDLKIAFLSNLQEPWPGINSDKVGVAKTIGMEDFLDKTEDLNVLVEKIKGILRR
ncbi:MAG: response regulator transcription factor [Candidatus Brennerbacteria bacterium]|nr:response regulator transcription factor [Candidatus Brennerbacteria bacterium]